MSRDDWKYDEEMLEGSEDGGAQAPTERQCLNCLHVIPVEAPYCPWCGKPLTAPARRLLTEDK